MWVAVLPCAYRLLIALAFTMWPFQDVLLYDHRRVAPLFRRGVCERGEIVEHLTSHQNSLVSVYTDQEAIVPASDALDALLEHRPSLCQGCVLSETSLPDKSWLVEPTTIWTNGGVNGLPYLPYRRGEI